MANQENLFSKEGLIAIAIIAGIFYWIISPSEEDIQKENKIAQEKAEQKDRETKYKAFKVTLAKFGKEDGEYKYSSYKVERTARGWYSVTLEYKNKDGKVKNKNYVLDKSEILKYKEKKVKKPKKFNEEIALDVIEKNFIKTLLKDPDSYRAINKKVTKMSNGDYQIYIKYRAKNSFGGYVVEEKMFIIDKEGDFKSVK